MSEHRTLVITHTGCGRPYYIAPDSPQRRSSNSRSVGRAIHRGDEFAYLPADEGVPSGPMCQCRSEGRPG